MPCVTTSSSDASEASCTASCRSCSERDMSRGRARPHKTAASRHGHLGDKPEREHQRKRHQRDRGRPIERKPGRAPGGGAPFPNLQSDAGMQPLEHDLSRNEIASAPDRRRSSCCMIVQMSSAKRHDRATENSSGSVRPQSSVVATRARAHAKSKELLVLCS